MKFVLVPTYVIDAINAKLDEALAACPDAAPDRDTLYSTLLAYFDEHGTLPEFHLARREEM